MDTSPLLPALRLPFPQGIVMAETSAFEDGDGMRATMARDALVIEVRSDGAEGQLTLPISALLEAIQTQTRTYGS